MIKKIAYWVFFVFFCSKLSAGTEPEPPFWGFYGHKKINRLAVFTLPSELILFYKKNIEYITEHAVDPDKRRYSTKQEGVRHFIDLDQWGKAPFDSLPRNWVDVLAKHTGLYMIQPDGDSILFTSPRHFTKGKWNTVRFSHPNLKKVFARDTVVLENDKYREFIANNIVRQYHEDEWIIPQDSIVKYFGIVKPNLKFVAKDGFSEHGILPYFLPQIQNRLTEAFVAKDAAKILRLSAEIGHYIGDAHVPLHTTSNYNGQKTNQLGIHAFWESRLPELYADSEYDFFVGQASYIENKSKSFWNIIMTSHSYVDSVLLIEARLRKEFPTDQQLCFDERLGMTVQTQCREFAAAYHRLLKGQVEDRMRKAVLAIGSAWYTAWMDAGQPDLSSLISEMAKEPADEEMEKGFQKGVIIGRPEGQ